MDEDAQRVLHLLKISNVVLKNCEATDPYEKLMEGKYQDKVRKECQTLSIERLCVYQYTKRRCYKERSLYFKTILPNKQGHTTGILQQSMYGSTVCY